MLLPRRAKHCHKSEGDKQMDQSRQRRDGQVLVYGGEMTEDFDIQHLIEQDRDDRMRTILGDFDPTEADA